MNTYRIEYDITGEYWFISKVHPDSAPVSLVMSTHACYAVLIKAESMDLAFELGMQSICAYARPKRLTI